VPLAATGITLLLLAAAVVHARRREKQYIVMTLQLAAASGFVAVARFGPVAF
jgi:hypothetical protein